MSSLWQFLSLAMLCGTVLTGGFMIALSMPESRMRDVCVQVLGWGVAGLSVLYAVSPVDLIPFFPVDDWVVLAGGIGAAIQAWQAGKRQQAA